MDFFANILSALGKFMGYQNSLKTSLFLFNEPECPKDLL